MEKKAMVIGLVALTLGVGAGYVLGTNKVAQEQPTTGGHIMADGTRMGGSMNGGMQEEMGSMMQGLSGKRGDAFDQAFLSEMIVHHQGAVEMAEAAIKDAKHQEIKDLAQKIITAQNSEIQQMKDWQAMWYGTRQ